MFKDIDDLLDAAIDEIGVALVDERREQDEVTVREYAERKGITVGQARRKLDSGAKTGKLAKRFVTVIDHRTAVYRAIKE